MIRELKKINKHFKRALIPYQNDLDFIYNKFNDVMFNGHHMYEKVEDVDGKKYVSNTLYNTIYNESLEFNCNCGTNFILRTKDKMLYYHKSDEIKYYFIPLLPMFYFVYFILSFITKKDYKINLLEKIYYYEYHIKLIENNRNYKHGLNDSIYEWKDKVLL